MALPPTISQQLFILCDSLIDGGEESVESSIAEMSRAELEKVLAECVIQFVDATERADKEIGRFQRRLAGKRGSGYRRSSETDDSHVAPVESRAVFKKLR